MIDGGNGSATVAQRWLRAIDFGLTVTVAPPLSKGPPWATVKSRNPNQRPNGRPAGPASALLLSIALVAIGCGNGAAPSPDAAGSFETPQGVSCDVGVELCAYGLGVCHLGVCTPQCSAVDYPRCPDGLHEYHEPHDGGDRCLCLP